jgi:hypothetical protein
MKPAPGFPSAASACWSHDARDIASCPGPPKTRRCKPSGIQRPRKHGLGAYAPPHQPADHLAGFLGPPRIKRGADILGRGRMRPPVTLHEKFKRVGSPSAMWRPNALAIERCGELGVGGDPGQP